ncbi:hypothetical protein GQ54DRAFT_308786 [Martensiomyces pterosporus]|nr:hypothetical protein GQ54DRAFT_308786 [Martensiomyces pterosporus]
MHFPTAIIALTAAAASAWPAANIFSASSNLPVTWDDVKNQTDAGVLRVSSSIAVASTDGDSFIPFSIQPSRVSAIANIYAVAYSLENGSIIAPVGRVKAEQLAPLGIGRGGMVSLRIPQPAVKELGSANGVPAVRLAILAPEASSPAAAGKWASDSVVFVLGPKHPRTEGRKRKAKQAE